MRHITCIGGKHDKHDDAYNVNDEIYESRNTYSTWKCDPTDDNYDGD